MRIILLSLLFIIAIVLLRSLLEKYHKRKR